MDLTRINLDSCERQSEWENKHYQSQFYLNFNLFGMASLVEYIENPMIYASAIFGRNATTRETTKMQQKTVPIEIETNFEYFNLIFILVWWNNSLNIFGLHVWSTFNSYVDKCTAPNSIWSYFDPTRYNQQINWNHTLSRI